MRAVTVTMFAFFFGFGFGAAVAQVSPYGQELYQQGGSSGRPTTYSAPRPASPYGQTIDTTTPSRPAWADSPPPPRYDIDTRRETRAPANDFDRRYGYGR